MKLKTYFGIAVALLFVTAISQEVVSLVRKPKVGEVAKYSFKADINAMGTTASMTAVQTHKVTKLADDGAYTVEVVQSETKLKVNGEDFPTEDSTTSSTTFKKDGSVAGIGGESPDPKALRLANIISFTGKEAATLSESWKNSTAGSEKTEGVGIEKTYTAEKMEEVLGLKCLVVKFEYKEVNGESSGSGYFWINTADATMVKMTGEFKNMPFPGAPVPIDAKLEVILSK